MSDDEECEVLVEAEESDDDDQEWCGSMGSPDITTEPSSSRIRKRDVSWGVPEGATMDNVSTSPNIPPPTTRSLRRKRAKVELDARAEELPDDLDSSAVIMDSEHRAGKHAAVDSLEHDGGRATDVQVAENLAVTLEAAKVLAEQLKWMATAVATEGTADGCRGDGACVPPLVERLHAAEAAQRDATAKLRAAYAEIVQLERWKFDANEKIRTLRRQLVAAQIDTGGAADSSPALAVAADATATATSRISGGNKVAAALSRMGRPPSRHAASSSTSVPSPPRTPSDAGGAGGTAAREGAEPASAPPSDMVAAKLRQADAVAAKAKLRRQSDGTKVGDAAWTDHPSSATSWSRRDGPGNRGTAWTGPTAREDTASATRRESMPSGEPADSTVGRPRTIGTPITPSKEGHVTLRIVGADDDDSEMRFMKVSRTCPLRRLLQEWCKRYRMEESTLSFSVNDRQFTFDGGQHLTPDALDLSDDDVIAVQMTLPDPGLSKKPPASGSRRGRPRSYKQRA